MSSMMKSNCLVKNSKKRGKMRTNKSKMLKERSKRKKKSSLMQKRVELKTARGWNSMRKSGESSSRKLISSNKRLGSLKKAKKMIGELRSRRQHYSKSREIKLSKIRQGTSRKWKPNYKIRLQDHLLESSQVCQQHEMIRLEGLPK